MASEARVLLIVVGQADQRASIASALRNAPHHLVFSTTVDDAQMRLAEAKPHLVLAVGSGAVDALEMCRRVRARPESQQVVVVVTGDDDTSAAHAAATDADADRYLGGPLRTEALREHLAPLLLHGRSTTDIKARPPLVAVGIEPPTSETGADTEVGHELAHAVDETEAGADAFASQTQPYPESAPPSALFDRSTGQANDQDTVVSFKNPFFEGSLQSASVEPRSASEVEEHVTQVALEAPNLQASEVVGPTRGLGAASPDPLEEPPINTQNHALTGRDPATRPITKSRLIAEVPRERTPTGDSGERAPPPPGARRGLDESQLGKRLAKRVRSTYRALEQSNFYQLLGVEPGASYPQIRTAFDELSLEFHPDRFFLLRSGDLKEKIYAIYRRVAEAFQVLGDDDSRQRYDASIAAAEPDPPFSVAARTDQGQRLAHLAGAAYQEGDLDHARLMLMLARTYERDNADIDAALARVVRRN